MAKPVRLYIRHNSDYARLMWFHNNKPNEMLIGFYGLYQKQANLRGIFPRDKLRRDLKALLFEYPQIRPINEKIDHITCHADGTFHIKTIGGREVYRETMKRVEPLGPNTPTFLEFIVLTHMSERYRMTTTEPNERDIFVDHLDNHIFIIEGRFSGANYKELEKEVLGRLEQIGVIMAPGFSKSDLAYYYKHCINGIEEVRRKAWEMLRGDGEDKGEQQPSLTPKDKV
jgi:hypothetical protein